MTRRRPRRTVPLAFRIGVFVVVPILRVSARRRWSGTEHVPVEGPVIAVSNHVTNLDPLTLAHFLYDHGRVPRFLAKHALFEVPVIGWFFRASGQIPVYRGTERATDALLPAQEALAAGRCLAVFPEGTLTRDPHEWPMAGRTGVARLALTTRAPVVPVAQWGPQDVIPRYSWRFRPVPRKTVSVTAGPPIDLSDLYDQPLTAEVLRAATDRIIDRLTEMVAALRGEEPPARRYDMRRDGDPRPRRRRRGRAGGTESPGTETPGPDAVA